MRTRIKMCGIMRPQDALLCARAGADAIGMIFHPPSRRNVSLETASAIIAALPPFVTPVGVFVDADANHIRQVCSRLGLRCVQLHGRETPDLAAALHPLAVIKSLRVDPATLPQDLDSWRRAPIAGLLLDTAADLPGGTGQPNNWSLIHRYQKDLRLNCFSSLIVAGGLTASNVARVIRLIRPWGVDVSSGIEKRTGSKSPSLVSAFAQAVHKIRLDEPPS